MPQYSFLSPGQNDKTIKVKTTFRDRIGILAEVSTLISRFGLNIVYMEVIRNDIHCDIYFEIENLDNFPDKDFFIAQFRTIQDFCRIERIQFLPHEENTNRFTVVLDNISDGVISIDQKGRITTINAVASMAFNRAPDDLIGEDLMALSSPDYPLLQCLGGENVKSIKHNYTASHGRYQYFSTCKPIHDVSGRIIGAVEIAKDLQEIKKLAKSLSQDGRDCFSDIIGRSRTINAAIAFAEKIAPTDISISLYGGSGTGKELFAKAIHNASHQKGPFIPINCAALPENLFESELFGYVAGSFTGGSKDGKPGLFEIAENGTVFLDEIADMPLLCQAKILRVIQEKAVRRIGGATEIPISARIITATNKNLEQLVKENRFRQDLFYRISILPIHIPPLSQRIEDIGDLAEHFLFLLANRLDKPIPELSAQALQKLHNHPWPGNVRELKNVIERAFILAEQNMIDADRILFNHELAQFAALPEERNANMPIPLKEQVMAYEKKIITDILASHRSLRQSAKALTLSHPGLIKKMRKYGIATTSATNRTARTTTSSATPILPKKAST